MRSGQNGGINLPWQNLTHIIQLKYLKKAQQKVVGENTCGRGSKWPKGFSLTLNRFSWTCFLSKLFDQYGLGICNLTTRLNKKLRNILNKVFHT